MSGESADRKQLHLSGLQQSVLLRGPTSYVPLYLAGPQQFTTNYVCYVHGLVISPFSAPGRDEMPVFEKLRRSKNSAQAVTEE